MLTHAGHCSTIESTTVPVLWFLRAGTDVPAPKAASRGMRCGTVPDSLPKLEGRIVEVTSC